MTPVISALMLLLAVPLCRADIDFKTVNHFTLPPDGATQHELWLQARTINFGGQALDDCFLLADSMNQNAATNPPTLRLSGTFQSDLWAAGETVELNGTVADHARLAAAKTLSVDGHVGGNLMGLATTITLSTNAMIEGSALLAGQDLILSGTINDSIRLYGSTVTLSGRFNGDVSITATDINIMPGTHIGGNLTYQMEQDLVLDSRVELGGKIIKANRFQSDPQPATSGSLIIQLALMCGAILTGMVLVTIAPGMVALSVHKLGESLWRCLLFGFVTFALVPLTAFFLLFTLVGIPLSLMLMLAYFLLLYMGKIIVGLYAGHLLLRRKTPVSPNMLFPIMSLGLLLLYASTNLPFPFGLLAWFTITLAGMGALVGAMLDRRIPVMISYPPADQNPPQHAPPKPPPLPGGLPPGAV